MNVAGVISAAFRRAPAGVQGPVVFTAPDGRTATGEAVGVPASGSPADGFKGSQLIRDRARRLAVLPTGLAFAPVAGMLVDWAGVRYSVLAVSTVPETGSVALYRVTVQR